MYCTQDNIAVDELKGKLIDAGVQTVNGPKKMSNLVLILLIIFILFHFLISYLCLSGY